MSYEQLFGVEGFALHHVNQVLSLVVGTFKLYGYWLFLIVKRNSGHAERRAADYGVACRLAFEGVRQTYEDVPEMEHWDHLG